jgi:hypothetical protein
VVLHVLLVLPPFFSLMKFPVFLLVVFLNDWYLSSKRDFQLIAARCVYFLFRQIWGGERFFYVLRPYLAVIYDMPRLHKFPKVRESSQNSKCQRGQY